jgi:acyl carrier protein
VDVTRQVIAALETSLGIPGRLKNADSDTALLGAIPELDSMAVVAALTALEERFGLEIDDDEIDGSTFATVGALVQLVERKLRVGVND